MVFMISEMLAPPFRWSISITWAVLLPPRMPAGFGAGAAFLPWGAFLAAGAFLADLLFTGAPLADCAPAFGLRVAFGFAGATSGLAASPKLWMRAQMRLAAVVASLNFLVGFSPGKLFRIANRRSAGQPAANSASSCSLVKLSNGVCTAADASSGVENATISFVSLIVNVVIIVLLGAALCAVITSITRKCLEVKAFLK